jgi:muramoyltetrapeptide carboxypeptidase
LAREHPTVLIGYSDVTALHLALYARAGWTGLSGPVATEWAMADDPTLRSCRDWAQGRTPSVDEELQPLAPGVATGPLLGGTLSVLTRLVGTPFAPSFEDAILVLEEVQEAPYRVDRMLAHLAHAGVLEAIGGLVLGQFTTGDLAPDKPTLSLRDVFASYVEPLSTPVATNLQYGHLLPRHTLPIGVPTRLTVTEEQARLEPQSPAVQ